MRETILLGQNGNAIMTFPCPVYTQKNTLEGDKTEYCLVCGDRIMAKYSALAPCKMEIKRLTEAWEAQPDHSAMVFQFVKDVK